MSKKLRRVMLFDGDPLVLEGLKFLLQDLHCDVIVERNIHALKQVLDANIDAPQLVMLPVELEDGTSGVCLVNEIRTRYKATVPAILFVNDFEVEQEISDQLNKIYLCNDLSPDNLRKIITNILGMQ